LEISGADLLNGTPIYDIKPYLPYADCKPEAVGGFAATAPESRLQVEFPRELAELLPAQKLEALIGVLAQDPRPSYHKDPDRVYGMRFGGYSLRFTVSQQTLRVLSMKRDPES
jgi:hypothetical protein